MDHKEAILSALNTLRVNELRSTDPSSKFKASAYNKAITSIRGVTRPIRHIDDVKGLVGIGPKILAKIAEILETGRLATAEKVAAIPESTIMDMLLNIHGIGPVKARELVAAGIRDIRSLRAAVEANPDLLNNIQTIGLRHYEDGCLRIPRAEIVEHEKHIHKFEHEYYDCPFLKWTITGSYRRGAETSGDIDVLFTHDSHYDDDLAYNLFHGIIKAMTRDGYIVDTLAHGDKKWMGYVRLRPDLPARRMDMMLVPEEEYPFAVLYFTGSDKFNVAMRSYCHTLGYTLNERRLACIEPGRPEPPICTTEEGIFEFLGLQYIPPHERVDARQIIRKTPVGGAGAITAR